jgi:hypothetical protein
MNFSNYGFVFNNIVIKNNKLIKTAKNEYGKNKIKNEIAFYERIIKDKINLPIPKIHLLDKDKGIIEMEYLVNCLTLTDIFYELDVYSMVSIILKNITILHNSSFINVGKEIYLKNIKIETNDKVLTRYYETKWCDLDNFNKIKKINGVVFKDMEYYLNKINENILKIINGRDWDYIFYLIHGDIHLGNILIDKNFEYSNNNIYFIDPRGYFGNYELFGIKEYDYAKLLFGISGYSIFDTLIIDDLEIADNNIEIPFIDKYCKIYDTDIFDDFTKLLSLSIWLGNNSNFINDKKKITSLMIAYYLCEKYLE